MAAGGLFSEPGPREYPTIRGKISHSDLGRMTDLPQYRRNSPLQGAQPGHQSWIPRPQDSPEFGLGGAYFPKLSLPHRKG